MVKYFLCLMMLAIPLAGCSGEREELKSPCVGNEGSPCGPRHPVNNWWLT